MVRSGPLAVKGFSESFDLFPGKTKLRWDQNHILKYCLHPALGGLDGTHYVAKVVLELTEIVLYLSAGIKRVNFSFSFIFFFF